MIGFLSILSSDSKPTVMFNYAQFLADTIHSQFLMFQIEEVFKYTFVLVYMFVYFQSIKFQFDMMKLNDDSQPQSVIFWTSLLMKDQNNYSYKSFKDSFVHPTISALSSATKPRVNEEINKIMKLTDQVRTIDWYLQQNYIEIGVYGCELAPCKLPKYLSMRIFALEYIRQMINANEVHFVSAKKIPN